MNFPQRSIKLDIRTPEQVSASRRAAQDWATQLGFSAIERTKFVTAASEIARNTLVHGGGGSMTMVELQREGRPGLQLTFEDEGPGIPDIDMAMTDGYSSVKSMGLGLGGTRRLVSEFDIQSAPGRGTRVSITQWKR